jgi:hypothetical protein
MTPQIQDDDGNGWREYRRLILAEIERVTKGVLEINDKLERLRNEDLSQLKIDIAMLQIKSGVWGALAGLCVAIGAALLKFAVGH